MSLIKYILTMRKNLTIKGVKVGLLMLFIGLQYNVFSQNTSSHQNLLNSGQKKYNTFWQHVQFGGGFGGGIGNQYSNIFLAPSAIYNFNSYVSAGTGLQMSYVSSKNEYHNLIVGGSVIGLFNPVPFLQLSVEVEELNISSTYEYSAGTEKNNFWNTGLFLGLGYRTENVTMGAKYNVLFNPDNKVYTTGLMPFVRVYF